MKKTKDIGFPKDARPGHPKRCGHMIYSDIDRRGFKLRRVQAFFLTPTITLEANRMASSATICDASQSLQCMFCLAQLDLLSISQREAHYEHHLINDIDTPSEGLWRTLPAHAYVILTQAKHRYTQRSTRDTVKASCSPTASLRNAGNQRKEECIPL